MLTGLCDHPVGLRFGVGQQPVGLGPGMSERGVGLRRRRADHAVRVLLGIPQHRIAGVQDILRVVEFPGDRILDVVDEFEDIAPRHNAARRHRHTARLFDDGAQFVERFKYSVHGAPSRHRRCYQCAWCYACDCGGDAGVSQMA